ncbi:transglutaminase-like cysteine peptidase [Microvirga antarctica]|uniref:transglutaminase-like cysteine peptidase n=1 Tax=Microvirga antarctica TaxID=2819233 RepID=UPI001B307C19|nr:transglutaminase-like cysteine peptidase [Microvirga antarctica]
MRQQNLRSVTTRGERARIGLKAAFLAVSLFGLGLAAQSQSASAQVVASLPSATQPIGDIGAAKPIQGWVKFCETFPGECAVNLAEPTVIELTPAVWKTLTTVNMRVNTNIKPVTDLEHWGVVDHWGFPNDGEGDCEDYQLLKRRMLADAGLPRRAMRMTVVIDELGEGHAVLMIRTSQGDYVLDNKTSSILPWEKTGYVFVKRESQMAEAWVSLGGITSPTISTPTTTANR